MRIAMTVTITRVSSDTFNQDIGGAKRAADNGPVIITDDGDKPAYVFLSHELYRRLLGPTLREMVPPIGDDIEFDPQPLSDDVFRPVDLP
jgi:hypothetical protein